jgi:hypothetical protein
MKESSFNWPLGLMGVAIGVFFVALQIEAQCAVNCVNKQCVEIVGYGRFSDEIQQLVCYRYCDDDLCTMPLQSCNFVRRPAMLSTERKTGVLQHRQRNSPSLPRCQLSVMVSQC